MADEIIEVVDNPDRSRFEIHVGDATAGYAEYRLGRGGITFTHTVVEDAFEGKGIGSKLAAAALDAARERNLPVTPLCPFIAAYIRRHPEYHALVAESFDLNG
jgi:predicted GNAT family acetyltransferase